MRALPMRNIRLLHVAAALAVTGVLGISAPSGAVQQAEPADTRPNIVVVVTDDQRADSLRYMFATKRIFRRNGTTFTNAYATTPLCCPARASILTGQYVHNHGVRTQRQADAPAAEAAEEMMIQKELRASGYATALFGKFLNNWDLENTPEHLDKWAIFGHSAPNGYKGGMWNIDGSIGRVDVYSTTYLRDRARDFIKAQEEDDDRPWFLYLAPAAPHRPFTAEWKYRRTWIHPWAGNPAVHEEDRTDKPLWVQQRNNQPYKGQRLRTKQMRTLMSVDDMVRVLSETVKKFDENERTLMIFMSDNGHMWSEHGLGTKRWPYTQSVQIPLMLRWPGTIEAGATDDRLVANIDVAPTIADVAEVSLPNADGRSLFSSDERARLLLEYFTESEALPTWASTLTHTDQYIEYYDASGLILARELYDLEADPWQLVNLLGDTDPTNDPSVTEQADYSLQLSEDRNCAGPSNCP